MSGRWTNDAASPPPPKKPSAVATIAAVLGISVAIVAFSPGGRHYLKHGRLPQI